MNAILVTVLTLFASDCAQKPAIAVAATPPMEGAVATTLCDLVARPSDYVGKSVTFTATYSSRREFAVLTDASCRPTLDESQLIQVTFANEYDVKSSAQKDLSKLIKRGQSARVTVTGRFTDPGRWVGHQLCCRYIFEIRKLLDVER